jgi:predicted GNAT superfamily acetyltransferase
MGDASLVQVDVASGHADARAAERVFTEVWGPGALPYDLMVAAAHTGGYLGLARVAGEVVGASFGLLARGERLHSHATAVVTAAQNAGVGRALKHHQRAWAAAQGLSAITWTFDPLMRRNAHLNLVTLGATVEEYLVDFYGPLADAVNAGDDADRLLVLWATAPGDPADTATEEPGGNDVLVPTPDDIELLRRRDPPSARAWRERVRLELGERLATGATVRGFSAAGEYIVAPETRVGWS